jgi:outer membrane protein OmpA-like peptidoglycan-associated protein
MKRLFRIASVCFLVVAGCATVPTVIPQAVIDARAALEMARKAKADLLVPEEFGEAQRLLDQAESSFSAEQTIATIEDLAFQAQSQAQIAEAHALTQQMEREFDATQKNLSEKTVVLAKLASNDQAVKDALANSKLSATQRLEAERLAKEARNKAEAEERRRKELEAMLREAETIPGATCTRRASALVMSLSSKMLFNSDSAQLQNGAKSSLDHVARFLLNHADYGVRIEGHTDDRTSNSILSSGWAESVLMYLKEQGVPFDSMMSVGKGPSQPIATNDTPAGRQLNRRVEIVLEKKAGMESKP